MTPEKRANVSLAYATTNLHASLSWRWAAGTGNELTLVDEPIAIPSIGSRTYLDLAAQYDITDSILLRAGVSNLLEEDPPLLTDNGT